MTSHHDAAPTLPRSEDVGPRAEGASPRARPESEQGLLEAQRLAFAPVAFQVARVMRDRGVLRAVQRGGRRGRSVERLVEETGLSSFALQTLLEAGLSFGLVEQAADGFAITRTGLFVENDPMTRVNMNFVHDVCYQSFVHLDEAIDDGTPAGLKVFGSWKTIYEGLSKLPDRARTSWHEFDHFYSDSAFPDALPIVMADRPRSIVDVGGNTGRFAERCCRFDPDVRVTIADLPGPLEEARALAAREGIRDRLTTHPVDMLDPNAELPRGASALWMSQFLVCFSEEEIATIVRTARRAMDAGTVLWVLDTFWDRQAREVATYCIHGTSPYFACIANGNSRMYSAVDMRRVIESAGLVIERQIDGLGLCHTLLRCRLP